MLFDFLSYSIFNQKLELFMIDNKSFIIQGINEKNKM